MKLKKNPSLPYLASAEHRVDGFLHVHILFPPYTSNDAINLKLDFIVDVMLKLEMHFDNQFFEFNLDRKVKNELGLKPPKKLKEKIHRQLKLISYDIKRIDNGMVDQQPLTDYITKIPDSCIVMSHAFKNKIKHNNINLNQINSGTKEIGHWLFHSTVLKFIEDEDLQAFLKQQSIERKDMTNKKIATKWEEEAGFAITGSANDPKHADQFMYLDDYIKTYLGKSKSDD